MMIKYFKIFVLIIFQISLIQSTAFALNQRMIVTFIFISKILMLILLKNQLLKQDL